MEFTVDSEDLVTIPRAAQELNIGVATLYRWMKSGKIQKVTFSRNTMIPKSEIERLRKSGNTGKASGDATGKHSGDALGELSGEPSGEK